MTFRAYRGNAFEHTHENKIFDDLYCRLEETWVDRGEPLFLLGNFFVDGRDFDAVIVKRNALIVLDFKDYGGSLSFSENGPWTIDGCQVKGGRTTNPFHQIRNNKFILLEYLERECNLQSSPNYGHIAGVCLFHRPIAFDSNSIPGTLSRWFHITDIDHASRDIDAIVSKAINLTSDDIQTIVDRLNVPVYVPAGVPKTVSFKADVELSESTVRWTSEQMAALAQVDTWLSENALLAQIIKGAAQTGKRTLLREALQRIVSAGFSPILIAPNARLAGVYKSQGFTDCQSVYSWLYAGRPTAVKDNLAVYPVQFKPPSPHTEVLVFVESHLLGDDYFSPDTVVYGSGFLLQDLFDSLQGISLGGRNAQQAISLSRLPKMLLLGDPYQLPRGSLSRSFIQGQIFEQRNITTATYELLSQVRPDDRFSEFQDFQGALIKAMVAKKYIRLPQAQGAAISELVAGSQRDQVANELIHWPQKTLMLCASNEQAYKTCRGIRRQYLGEARMDSLTVGDIVDFHNRTPNILTDGLDFDEQGWVDAWQFGQVRYVEDETSTRSIKLKGRDEDTVVAFGRALVELSTGVEVKINFLPDYLAADKPALTKDQLVALQIWSRQDAESQLAEEKAALEKLRNKGCSSYEEKKANYEQKLMTLITSSQYFNAARLRYAYALTVHRAQIYNVFSSVILDASRAHDTQNSSTDSYFRWLYTATVCASEKLKLLNYPKLAPFSEASWMLDGAKVAPWVVKKRFYFDKRRKPEEADLLQPIPNGFANTEPELLALYLSVRDRLQGTSWEIKDITQHQYRQRYLCVNNEDTVEIDFHYNGKFEVTLGAAKLLQGENSALDQLAGLMNTDPIFVDENIAIAVDEFALIVKSKGWEIVAADEKLRKVYIDLSGHDGNLKVEINIPGRGLVSSVKLHQAENVACMQRFVESF